MREMSASTPAGKDEDGRGLTVGGGELFEQFFGEVN